MPPVDAPTNPPSKTPSPTPSSWKRSPARPPRSRPAGPELSAGCVEVHREDAVAVTVAFAATDPGYLGMAVVGHHRGDRRRPADRLRSRAAARSGALVAPAWVPWEERIRPGDLGPGDLLLPVEDDPRVVPAYLESDDPAVEDVAHELGVGRGGC